LKIPICDLLDFLDPASSKPRQNAPKIDMHANLTMSQAMTGKLNSRLRSGVCSILLWFSLTIGAVHADCTERIADAKASAAQQLQSISAAADGIVGACVSSTGETACVNDNVRFPMQSVMKLLVAVAVLDRVDQGRLHLNDPISITRANLSVEVQPLAALLANRTRIELSVADLLERMITESDSAATDILIAQVGGPAGVQATLASKELGGLRIDRTERELQTQLVGLRWRDDLVDPAAYQRAVAAVPAERRREALQAARSDPRDTATPAGMARLLVRLSDGTLLLPQSSAYLLGIMERTRTFPDRLAAGAPVGWKVAHKTGTSRTFEGTTEVTNDVGYLIAPDGSRAVAVAFLTRSPAPAKDRATVLAAIGRAASQYHHERSEASSGDCTARRQP
jgi:beta-lactamase class A